MAGLTTHVLDLEKGTPAAGLRIVLKDEAGAVLAEAFTDADGRCDGPLLGAESVKAG
ncbi:MAG: hydroxyisourate hydrolase, partial [Pseudomonadota bacterium]